MANVKVKDLPVNAAPVVTDYLVLDNAAGTQTAKTLVSSVLDLKFTDSGTYTPTLFNTTNVAASTAYVCMWTRVGNIVTVTGLVDIDITTTLLATIMGMSLPVTSLLANFYDLAGVAVADAVSTSFRIQGDAANDRAQFRNVNQVTVANTQYGFTFSYRVLS